MTPMEKAATAYVRETGEVMDGHERQGMEAACLAYVAALAGDEKVITAMVKAFAPDVPETVKGVHYETEWSRLYRRMSVAAKAIEAQALTLHKEEGT